MLAEARVDDIHDAVDGDGGLRDVRRHHHLAVALGRGLEHSLLLVWRQGRIQRQNLHLTLHHRTHDQLLLVRGERLRLLLQSVAGVVDLLLAREEHQDVARVLQQVDLVVILDHHGMPGSLCGWSPRRTRAPAWACSRSPRGTHDPGRSREERC